MLDKLERKWGRLAVPHLMRYIIFGNVLVYLISMFFPGIVYYLNLIPDFVLRGQVWRLISFIFIPSMGNIMLTALSLFCYFWIGEALERSIGSFKFGCYYFFGWLAIVAVTFLMYFLRIYNLGFLYDQMSFFNQTLFLSLALLHPDVRILLFYVIPLKAKWAGLFSFLVIAYEFVVNPLGIKMLILASFVPFLIFFLPGFLAGLKGRKRRKEFERKMNAGYAAGMRVERARAAGDSKAQNVDRTVKKVAFHRCTVCGITELDDPNMMFRYCSGCNGNYEYCEQHIHNHSHVQ